MPKLTAFHKVTEYTVVFTEEEMRFLLRLIGNRYGEGNNREISNAILGCLMSAEGSEHWDRSDVLEVHSDGVIAYRTEQQVKGSQMNIKAGDIYVDISDNEKHDIGICTRPHEDFPGKWWARW